MADFRETYPIDFDLYDKDAQNVLYIEDASDQTLTLSITNASTQNIELNDLDDPVSSTNYHFALRFRPGTLSSATLAGAPDGMQLATGAAQNWQMTTPQTDISGMDVIYLKRLPTNLVMNTGTVQTLVFENVGADAGQGARGTRVELRYTNMAYSGGTDITSTREIHLSVINYRGKQNIPLHVGIVGDNGVLNSGGAANTLTVRFSNTLTYDTTNPDLSELTFVQSLDETQRSKFILSFDDGTTDAGALATSGQINNITITQPVGWAITKDTSGPSAEWTLYPDTTDQVLYGIDEPNGNAEYFDLTISNIVTSLPTGHTHLHIRYENIPGYWDGQLKVTLEKRPLVYSNNNVGIGTSTPSDKLTVYNGELTLQTNDNAADQGILFQNSADAYTWRMYRSDTSHITQNTASLIFASGGPENDKDLLIDRVTFTEAGNVGIGTTNPTTKLDVKR